MVGAEKVVWYGFRGGSRKVQHVCEEGAKDVRMTVVKTIKLACGENEKERKNATILKKNMDMETKLVEAQAGGSTMRVQFAEAKHRLTALKTQVVDACLALEKQTGETSRTKDTIKSRVLDVEESLNAKIVGVESFKPELATKTKIRRQLLG